MGTTGVGVGGQIADASGDKRLTEMIAIATEAGIDPKSGQPQNTADDKQAFQELNAMYLKDSAKATDEFNDIIKNKDKSKFINSKTRLLLKNLKPDERDKLVLKLAQLRLIENRMKYIVANANKGEDRLTVKDVEEAEKSTRIFGFGISAERVQSDYIALDETLNATYNNLARKYIMVGGKPQELMDHEYTRKYKVYKFNQAREKGQAPTISNQPTQSLIDSVIGK